MGDNSAYSDFEQITVGLYDLGRLDKKSLSVILETWRERDIDSGGYAGTLSKDGLDCEEIVIKLFGGNLPVKTKLPKDSNAWTDAQEAASEKYWEDKSEAFGKITRKFGWG